MSPPLTLYYVCRTHCSGCAGFCDPASVAACITLDLKTVEWLLDAMDEAQLYSEQRRKPVTLVWTDYQPTVWAQGADGEDCLEPMWEEGFALFAHDPWRYMAADAVVRLDYCEIRVHGASVLWEFAEKHTGQAEYTHEISRAWLEDLKERLEALDA